MPSLLLFTVLTLVATISPGPDFAIVFRNALLSRRAGLYTALGITFGLMVHLIYILFGLGYAITQLPMLFTIIRYGGAAYLFYLGISSFRKSQRALDSSTPLTGKKAWLQGVVTNILNPKCILFLVSFLSQFITPETSVLLRVEYGMITLLFALSWFTFIALLLTLPRMEKRLERFKQILGRVMGCILIALSLKILF